MRSRPDVDLRLPPVVHPGEVLDLELVITSGSETPIDFIELVFACDELVGQLANGNQQLDQRPVLRDVHRLREAGTLAEGEHRFPVKLSIPEDAAPSYLGVQCTIRYELRLHVSIPWWPDLRETYELLVEPRAAPRPRPKAGEASSEHGSGPFIELSLADTAFAPNDEVVGAFAVGNAPHDHDHGVEISLVATEKTVIGRGRYSAEQFNFTVPTVFKTPVHGGEVPFRFRVPRDVFPTFRSARCELAWFVHAAMPLSEARRIGCSIPVAIDRHAGPRAADRGRPEIGAARWRRAWSAAGEPRAMTLAEGRFALEGSRGDVQIEVALDRADEEQAVLVATLRYPSLGLGLRVTPQMLVLLPTPLELLLGKRRVEHREAAQARALLTERLVEALNTFDLSEMDDTHLVVRSPAAGFDEAATGQLLDRVLALVEALTEAMDAVPPPAAMKEALPAWRAFAASSGARLSVGGMALESAGVDGAAFDVTTRFGARAEVTGTTVSLRIDPPLDHAIDLANPVALAAAPPGSRELAAALQAAARRVSVEPHTLAIEVDGPTSDPSDLRPRMAQMLVLARRLRGERSVGPYR